MPKVGDRVIVQGSKVGGARREGTLRKVVGSLIQVRWVDGTETLFAPGAGTVQFLPGNGNSTAAKNAAKKGKPATKSKPKTKGQRPKPGTKKR
ncbi:MAG: DUF1918 domain-containing protein [Actinomycetota bacterium]